MSNILKGIDVSKYQGNIQWDKVKPNIDFAILRCGFGSDIAKQDDVCFERNLAECERLNIPFAVYLYSYATTEQKIDSEISHTLRLLGSHKPFCVYIDMEDNSTTKLGKAKLTAFAKRFCEGIKAKGFKVGVYANENWCKNYLDVAELHKSGYSIWCAKYSENQPNIAAAYDIWQHSSKGIVGGIVGNVDMNYMYNDIRNVTESTPIKKTVSELAQEVLVGMWGNGQERKAKLTQAGYDYNAVQKEVNKLATKTTAPAKKSNEEIAREVVQGKWGNGATRKKKLTDAGYNYSAIQKLVNKMM